MNETEKGLWLAHEKRFSEHENKIAESQKDYTELKHEIRQLIERINMGVSPSVNEVRKENSEIKLAIQNLDHKVEMSMVRMEETVKATTTTFTNQLITFEKDKIDPVGDRMDKLERTILYGVLAGVLGLIITLGGKAVWEKIFKPETPLTETQRVENLKAERLKR